MGDYATSIVDAIDNARVFVVVLNGTASHAKGFKRRIATQFLCLYCK